jgi:hypothetical protein
VLGALLGGHGTRPDYGVLFALGVIHHSLACTLNDLADEDDDRDHGGRASAPLVSGAIDRVGAVASLCGLLLTALAIVGYWRPSASSTFLLAGLFALATYGNLWQKRSRHVSPVVMDHFFGLMMGIPIVYGAAATGGHLDATVWLSAVTFSLSMTLMNCVAGNLKDLAADHSARVRTTALELGVLPGPDGHPRFSTRYRRYVVALCVGWGGALLALGLVEVQSRIAAGAAVAVSAVGTVWTLMMLRSLFAGTRSASPTGSEPYIYLQFVALNVVLVSSVGAGQVAILFACSAGWVYLLAFVELHAWRWSRSEH